MARMRTIVSVPAVVAALGLLSTPAAAADFAGNAPTAPIVSSVQYGPYFGAGWGGGWRGHRHRGRSSAGDILTGVLVLGTIAAVASAATRNNRQRGYPDRYPYPDRRSSRPDQRRDGPRGLQGAADLCVREVERETRVRDVTRVERDLDGWQVAGTVADGRAFTCSIAGDGRIDRVEVGGSSVEAADTSRSTRTDRQYDDDRFRSARAAAESGPMPAYPGGPLPGEELDGAAGPPVEGEPPRS